MSVHASPELEHAKSTELRAHAVKMAMYNNEDFIAGIREGYAQENAGQMMTWAELRQALGRG